jgi:hypothetical protein
MAIRFYEPERKSNRASADESSSLPFLYQTQQLLAGNPHTREGVRPYREINRPPFAKRAVNVIHTLC